MEWKLERDRFFLVKAKIMKILITGANGMVARAAINYCRSIGDTIVALTRQELDISDKQSVFNRFEKDI